MASLVSPYHPGPAGACGAGGRAQRHQQRLGDGKKGELIDYSVPEIRRLLTLLGPDAPQRAFHLHWSQWRRRHQWRAQQAHSRRRALQAERMNQAPVAEPSTVALPAPLLLASLPPLTEERWERIAPLLPPQRPPTGRPATAHRQILEGMLWVMQAGTSWRQMPRRYGPWHTIYGRFQRWTREGLWAQIRTTLLSLP